MKKHILYIIAIISTTTVIAQNTTEDGNLGNENVVVVKDYEAFIEDAQRIKINPATPEQEFEKIDVEYNVPNKLMNLDYPAHTMRPLAMPKLKREKYQNSYLRIGFGTQLSPLAEIAYHDDNLEDFQFGAYYKHLSAYGQKIKNQSFRDNEAGIYFQYFKKKIQIGADVNYTQNVDYFYGYNHDSLEFKKDEIKQRVSEVGASVYMTNGAANMKNVDFAQTLSFSNMSDAYDVKEWYVNFQTDISKTFNNKHIIHTFGEVDVSNYIPTFGDDLEREYFQLGADYTFNNDDFKLTAGLTTAWGEAAPDGKFNLYPTVYTEKKLFKNYLIFYSSWSRRLQKNSYLNFVQQNPYININPELKNGRVEDRIAGFKGTAKKYTYNVKFSNKVIKEMALFVNDTLDEKRFDIVYDKNMTVINLNAEMGYTFSPKFHALLGFDFMLYEPDEQAEAWHMPAFKTNLLLKYNLKKKFFLTGEIYSLAGAKTRLANGDAEKIKGMVDLNLGAEYQFSKYLSFFVQLNNLANFKYEKWQHYPTYGFNGRIGAQLSF
ncbi:MAG: hypothetical protein ACPG4Z_06475 [Chitinophagales bacterium]